MALVDILHMNSGSGDSSYTNNSLFTKIVMQKTAPFLKRTIKGMANKDILSDHCFMIADLGCSSGMNTLSLASNIIDIVHEVFVPGSFYGRLFPDESLHLIHSSYSVHWLSQVPEGLENNKQNIYIAKTSPLDVLQAYGKQFQTDFTKFLQLRYEEIVHDGRMVIVFQSRSSLDPTNDECSTLWELLIMSLLEMLKEGLVLESDINSFNLPFYFPHGDELRRIIEEDGSFSLDDIDIFEVDWDQHDMECNNRGKKTTKSIRAVTELLFSSHFGNSIIDMLFKKFEKKLADHLATKKTRHLD
ncbi:putative methyltransferase [Helianthus annuus]|nr:putative methyltransferase [Helianthus annuus]